ncbi:MAG: hypothetical protein PHC29_05105 [Candidatus Omnitrophica bacterium]|nr:hypothetical protein [Candidatus Omnitrophota bacterium]
MSDELSKLWRPQDDKGNRLYSGIPNCLLMEIINGTYKPTESQVLLFIARMSCGMMRREQTNYLGLGDIEAETGIKIPHLSKIINELIRKGILLRGKESAKKYKYAINLYYYGLPMKYYKIRHSLKEIKDDEEVFGVLDYRFGKPVKDERAIVVYNSKGYEKQENGYIKTDINTDRKIDTTVKNNSYNSLVSSFMKDIKEHDCADTILKHMQQMHVNGYNPDLIILAYDAEWIRKGYVAPDVGKGNIETAEGKFKHWLKIRNNV